MIPNFFSYLIFVLFVGIGSTLIMDIYAIIRCKMIGIPTMNWGLAGRWLLGLAKLQFFLNPHDDTAPSRFEHALGWLFHYAVGLIYAWFLLLISGSNYISQPNLYAPLLIAMVIANFAGLCIMAPAMGAGLLARKTANPFISIMHTIILHGVFLLAQYAMALLYLHF